MSLFSQYLAESKKQYAFRIKLACECSKEQMAKLKEVMNKYDVAAISEPKVTPIAETHAGFEHLKNVSLSIIDLLTNYPVTPQQIREMIRDHLGISEAMIMVRTTGEEANAMPVAPVEKGDAVLTQDYPKTEKPNMLADLQKMLDEHESIEYPFAVKPEGKAKTSNDLPEGNVSPVGSKQNKIPTPKKK